MLYDHEGQTVYSSADLAALTGAPAAYLAGLNANAAPVRAATVAGLLSAFDTVREVAWKWIGAEDRADAHPALAHWMSLPVGRSNDAARADTLAALAADGYDDADRPLTDANVRALLGPALYRLASRLFPRSQRAFYDEAAVETVKAGYAVKLAELEVESRRNAAAREARKSRGPARSEQYSPFTVDA